MLGHWGGHGVGGVERRHCPWVSGQLWVTPASLSLQTSVCASRTKGHCLQNASSPSTHLRLCLNDGVIITRPRSYY